jgi:hypothetical protein
VAGEARKTAAERDSRSMRPAEQARSGRRNTPKLTGAVTAAWASSDNGGKGRMNFGAGAPSLSSLPLLSYGPVQAAWAPAFRLQGEPTFRPADRNPLLVNKPRSQPSDLALALRGLKRVAGGGLPISGSPIMLLIALLAAACLLKKDLRLEGIPVR